jgi:hypothetical protein
MLKHFLGFAIAAWGWQATAAERVFDFSAMAENEPPPGLRNALAGEGKPGLWKIILDDVPPLLAPLTPNAPVVTKRAVLAQLAQDTTDEHFPLLIDDSVTYSDFTLTTRFKIVSGTAEQMAGIAFRLQDEKNFYVLRASALGNNLRFYKMVNGQRSAPIGPSVDIPKGAWHDLTIECKGNQIRCLLNGKEVLPTLTDNSFMHGKIAFWTKSDSVSYFVGTKVTYVPQEVPAQVIVRDTMKKYPRLLGIKVFAQAGTPRALKLVASSDEKEVGKAGGVDEQNVLDKGAIYYGKGRESVSVILPMRDRNGDVIAAVRVVMRTFTGQTEQNAIVRAQPIVKEMQARVRNAADLLE